jgi:hypothetical protein
MNQYLNRSIPDSYFSFLEEYRSELGKFVNIIQNYTATGLKTIFQQELSTSTAAWPNYVKWNHHPQRMPLTSDFVSALQWWYQATSGWMGTGLPIPAHEYTSSIGKKLSHPGDEVLSIIAQILDKVCTTNNWFLRLAFFFKIT